MVQWKCAGVIISGYQTVVNVFVSGERGHLTLEVTEGGGCGQQFETLGLSMRDFSLKKRIIQWEDCKGGQMVKIYHFIQFSRPNIYKF